MRSLISIRSVAVACAFLALAGCTRPPESAFLNRGGPESLLDVSSEVVNLGVASQSNLKDLSRWIDKDQPTRAELYCTAGDPRCAEAKKVLDLHGVPTVQIASRDNNVALVYERILARDCNARYVETGENDYEDSAPAFGCSLAANMVQQVSDKQEFINPNLADNPRANGAVASYNAMYAPKADSAKTTSYSVDKSVVGAAKTN